MQKRIHPAKPHFIVGYAGHCPKYRYIQKERGTPHQFCIDQSRKYVDTEAKLKNADLQDHKLTFTEIDLVMAYERDPNYVLPNPPSPENFLLFVNNHLGPKPSFDFPLTVANYQQKIKHQVLEKSLEKRLEALNLNSSKTDQTCKQSVSKAVNSNEQNLDEYDQEKRQYATTGKVDLIAPQKESPYEKFVKDRNKTFNIYRNDAGLIPRYAGHIPGSSFRFGSTFGQDSKNAKQWMKKSYMNVHR